MISDTMLVGVPMFSETATSAFPPSSRKMPTMPAARHCFGVVRSPVRIDVHANSTVAREQEPRRSAEQGRHGLVDLLDAQVGRAPDEIEGAEDRPDLGGRGMRAVSGIEPG